MFEGGTLTALLLLSALPFVLLATTSFVKLAVVFSALRSALGAVQVPSSMLVTLLAILLSAYVMAPVVDAAMLAAEAPARRVDLDNPTSGSSLAALGEVWTATSTPVRGFLAKHAGERERAMFLRLAERAHVAAAAGATAATTGGRTAPAADDLMVLMPAFLITELKEALQIAFLIFLPFLVVELVVANVLAALGMHMISAAAAALPLKLLLFVLVDGWYMLSEALVLSYFR